MGKLVRIFMCIPGFFNRSTLNCIINFEKDIIPKNRKFCNVYGYFGKKINSLYIWYSIHFYNHDAKIVTLKR